MMKKKAGLKIKMKMILGIKMVLLITRNLMDFFFLQKDNTEKNKIQVNLVRSGSRDLKEKIEEIGKDEKKLKNQMK